MTPRRDLTRVDLLDTRTAALALGVTPRTIRRYVRDGQLTNHGHGRRILLDLAELQEHLSTVTSAR